jgi:hypothetical protein
MMACLPCSGTSMSLGFMPLVWGGASNLRGRVLPRSYATPNVGAENGSESHRLLQ